MKKELIPGDEQWTEASATKRSWSARAVHAWFTFNKIRRDKDAAAALRYATSRIGRSVVARTSALASRLFRRLARDLPLPKLFMRRGVLFIGYLEAGLGLGESLRGLVRSIDGSKIRFGLYPYSLGVETRLMGKFMPGHYDLRRSYKINIIEMSPDQVPAILHTMGRWKTERSYNILRTYWELPRAPSEWANTLKPIDELWVPNDFVLRAFQDIFFGPIVVVPPCVLIETNETFDRHKFGMDKDIFYFLFSFDYYSTPSRKNPLAVVRAFQMAFPNPSEKVGLILKSTSGIDQHLGAKSEVLLAAGHDLRITITDCSLSRDKMLSLIQHCDCYVSLHRSEGFGLGMAEALAFGRPVIGSDYSGSTDFLSERTGFPVPVAIRPVQPDEYPFSTEQSWAEPDEAAAAEAMRFVFSDETERQRRATAGRSFVEARYGRENVGRIATRRLQTILASI